LSGGSRNGTHLAYKLEIPAKPGEAQRVLGILKEGSFVLSAKVRESSIHAVGYLSICQTLKHALLTVLMLIVEHKFLYWSVMLWFVIGSPIHLTSTMSAALLGVMWTLLTAARRQVDGDML
jgi:hypothetical protein